MSLKLSYNTWAYSSYPSWLPAYTLEETIKRLAAIGYDGIEIGAPRERMRNRDQLKRSRCFHQHQRVFIAARSDERLTRAHEKRLGNFMVVAAGRNRDTQAACVGNHWNIRVHGGFAIVDDSHRRQS